MRRPVKAHYPQVVSATVTPPWLLFFWRLVRGEAEGDYALAWRLLPARLPRSIRRPDLGECVAVLIVHGLEDW